MLSRDEAGPIGQVSTSWGLGLGSGYKRGPVGSPAAELISPKIKKRLLQEQIKLLQKKIEVINQQLDNL